MKDNLKKLQKDYKWLENELAKFKIKPKEVLLATIDGNGKIFCQKKISKSGGK